MPPQRMGLLSVRVGHITHPRPSSSTHQQAPDQEVRRAHITNGEKNSRLYRFVRLGRPSNFQWELAIGTAVVVAFKVFARWNDAMQLRWDAGYCEISELYVRFFLEHRKNAQFNGNFVDVARPGNGEYGAYHVICGP